jgi:RNA polymerase sigma-70 factor (ECF subfamily)
VSSVTMPADLARLEGPADFDETFREHYEPMVRSLAAACGDREAAADAVQDAFTRAYTRWRRISRYDSPAGWIRHVALNRLRDHFRREERAGRARTRLAGETPTEVAPPEPPDGDLTAAISRLPRQQRIAVSLFYVERLSVREIATSMKLSEGAVKYHLHAGRAALREWLERG